jgi:hypothetical protein
LLDAHEGKTPGAALVLGVVGPANLFHPALAGARGPAACTYRVFAPVGQAVRVVLDSGAFRFTAPGGGAAERSSDAQLLTPGPADQGRKFQYRLTGVGAR